MYISYFNSKTEPFTSAMIICNLKEAGKISLKIYDAKVKKIITLCNERKDTGVHIFNWSGNDRVSNTAGSGIYIVHIKAG